MNINEIDFNVNDARRISNESKKKKEFVHYKFHAAIVKKIKQRAENRFYFLKWVLPIYLFG